MALNPLTAGPGRFRSRTLGDDTTPEIYSVTPNSDRAAGGVAVTITGNNFQSNAIGTAPTVRFGATLATSVVLVSINTITCNAPAHVVGLVDITVTNPNGQFGILPNVFTYYDTVLFLVTPNYGPIAGGTSIQIIGANFKPAPAVTVGGITPGTVIRIDSQHISVITPAHAQGPADVVVDGVTMRGAFMYTLLTRGEDLRRNPSIRITESINAPSSCSFVVDGRSVPPLAGEEFEFLDDSSNVLFAGVVQTVQQKYEEGGETDQLLWEINCTDYTAWLNRRRPNGSYIQVSATDIVKDLIAKYAPWVTVAHVQSGLCELTLTFDGTEDFATVLTTIAKALGGGYWRIDYNKDLHFFRSINIASGNGSTSEPITNLGGGEVNPTPPVLSQSSSVGVYLPGYYMFCCAFRYSDGIVSTPGPFSELMLLDGHHLPQLDSIPTGAAIGGLTVTDRIIYYKFFGFSGGVPLAAGMRIHDNVTTTVIATPDGNYSSLNLSLGDMSGVARIPTVAPPVGPPRAPDASQISDMSARTAMGQVFPDFFGPGGSKVSFSFPSGTWAFKMTDLYDDGTESQPSEASGRRNFDGQHAVRFATNNTAGDVNGRSVIARKIYGSRAARLDDIPDFSAGTTSLWFVFPDNGNATITIVPAIKQDNLNQSISTVGSQQPPGINDGGVQHDCVVGPNPEEPDYPDAITSTSTTLLRDPQITHTIDVTQLRNRVIVYGQAVIQPPNVVTPPPTGSGTGSYVQPPVVLTSQINQYAGAAAGFAGFYGIPMNYIRDHPQFYPWSGYPLNQRWNVIMTTTRYAVVGGTTDVLHEYIRDTLGISDAYVLDHPYTVFMDLPETFYDIQAPPTPVTTVTTQDIVHATALPEKPTIIRTKYQVDDLDSQRFMGRIELDAAGNPTDGVHEFGINTTLETAEECIAFGKAQLEQFAWPLITVRYATRDPKSHPGRMVHIDLTDPPIKGDFLILAVDVDQIKEEAETTDLLSPRYTVTAADPVKFNLDDLLLLIGTVGDQLGLMVGGSGLDQDNALNVARMSMPLPVGQTLLESAAIVFTETDIVNGTMKLCVAGVPGYLIVPMMMVFFDDFSTSPGGWNTSRAAVCRYVSGSGNDLISPSNTFFQNGANKNSGFALAQTIVVLGTNNELGVGVNVGPSGNNILLSVSPSGYTAKIKLFYLLTAGLYN